MMTNNNRTFPLIIYFYTVHLESREFSNIVLSNLALSCIIMMKFTCLMGWSLWTAEVEVPLFINHFFYFSQRLLMKPGCFSFWNCLGLHFILGSVWTFLGPQCLKMSTWVRINPLPNSIHPVPCICTPYTILFKKLGDASSITVRQTKLGKAENAILVLFCTIVLSCPWVVFGSIVSIFWSIHNE